ncbi:mitochondrial import receptor subunit TOM20 homolog B-like [Macrosteles quadrilineatus]|uniref:mitochondrial import receptor subunit TOM20 homolog B-like n=1 Tax=Macrosteles quadrilineatus TaxID=74068 RepID=UPI0023E1DC40|nr:mitochondrial import receptor subunit TOM20 homolog B-like [Macrosteles quadrilineatus]XP_054284867.1 mitochondrial import receptor subunit TOM20 homolog B-like [Macrosteles quadrilineatus]
MTMISLKAALGLAAGASATLFIGYCIYFDRKRRSDPNFKKKLKERRTAKREAALNAKNGKTKIPDLKDHEAVQMFFLQEVQKGEELLGAGDEEGGVEHLSNAVAVCGQPNQLLQVLQQTLPPHVFQLLLLRLPAAGQRFMAQSTASTATVVDDGVD